MMRKRWEPCQPPQGYSYGGKPYRAWRNTIRTDVVLVECPSYMRHVDSGQWELRIRAARIGTLHWYGRSRKNPPTLWANRILEQTP